MSRLDSEPDTGPDSRQDIPQAGSAHDPETARWLALASATGATALCQAWLELQARQLEKTRLGLVLVRNPADGAFIPAAIWPDPVTDVTSLIDIAQRALTERRGIEIAPDPSAHSSFAQIALPIETESDLYGVAVFALADGRSLPQARRQLFWGGAWLSRFFIGQESALATAQADRAARVLDLALSCLETLELQEALLALVNGLAVRLSLRRASLGLEKNGRLRVMAISHAATFKRQSESVQLLEKVLEEAYEQQQDLHYPALSGLAAGGRFITVDHQRLVDTEASGGVASFLLRTKGRPFGVLTLEYHRDKPLAPDDLALGEALVRLLAPVLDEKRELNRWLTGRLKFRLQKAVSALLGPYHATYKLAAMGALLGLAVLLFAEGEFRITAKTVIEGLVQRAAVAPFEGYIGQAPVRAGDQVTAGQLVATLDDKDLQLEKTRLTSEREQTLRKYRDAVAKHDRAGASVLGAALHQTEAELNLVGEKLARSVIRAPFDGVVVSGDLSQMLGAPVEQGKVLFEIAPLDAYRVILKVDERDIAYVRDGMKGRLALSGLTVDPQPFVVKKVTPVATAEEGVNYFRVEAELERASPLLRPGMEGVGKIVAGEEKLWWLWTRRLTDWIRITLWTWLP